MSGEPGPLVDRPALRTYLQSHLPGGLEEPFDVVRHRAGHSNETFFLRSGDRRFVLRRPPRGAFLPTAHDVLREYRVLSALEATPARTPLPLLACDDASIIGAPFYLMERIDGVVIRDRLPEGLDAGDSVRRTIGEELADALAELHSVDWQAAGLEGFGKPSGYLRRQLRRWSGQLSLTEPLTRHLPDLRAVGAWLQDHVPGEAAPAIVHGDYKLDNVCFSHAPPARLRAIFDWEMSTIGDPLADLGWLISFWREAGDPPGGHLDGLGPTGTGFCTRTELIERYEVRSGRSVGDLTFYAALAQWKLAILLEGSYARHLAGMTDDPFFARLATGVPGLAARALALTREGLR